MSGTLLLKKTATLPPAARSSARSDLPMVEDVVVHVHVVGGRVDVGDQSVELLPTVVEHLDPVVLAEPGTVVADQQLHHVGVATGDLVGRHQRPRGQRPGLSLVSSS